MTVQGRQAQSALESAGAYAQPKGKAREQRMTPETVQVVLDALEEAGVDLVVTLPEEPTFSLTETVRTDPRFRAVTVAAEGNGIAMCAGASLAGRPSVFVTGVAGMLVGTWALAQMGMVFGAPILILASYRGDFGDRTGIPGSQLLMFKQVAEPLLDTLHIPYRVLDDPSKLKQTIVDANFAAHYYGTPIALLLTGEVLG